MRKLPLIFCLFFLHGCVSSPRAQLDYSQDSRVVLVNGISSEANYTYLGRWKKKEQKYPVDWGIAELVEERFRSAAATSFIVTEPAAVLKQSNFDDLVNAIRKNDRPEISDALVEICSRESADAIVFLGTRYDWFDWGYIGGFGAYNSYARDDENAYAFLEVGVLNCEPLEYVNSAWFLRKPVGIPNLALPENVADLSAKQLALIEPFVIEALTTSDNPETEPPIEHLAKKIDEVFN